MRWFVISILDDNIKAKPFQVLPFIEAGGLEKYQITPEELALMCASHGGEPERVSMVAGLLEKPGFSESDLCCGSAAPMNSVTMRKMLKQGETWNQLHNCCSGKHAAMLALAAMKGYDPDHYEKISHPVQQEMLGAISQVTVKHRYWHRWLRCSHLLPAAEPHGPRL